MSHGGTARHGRQRTHAHTRTGASRPTRPTFGTRALWGATPRPCRRTGKLVILTEAHRAASLYDRVSYHAWLTGAPSATASLTGALVNLGFEAGVAPPKDLKTGVCAHACAYVRMCARACACACMCVCACACRDCGWCGGRGQQPAQHRMRCNTTLPCASAASAPPHRITPPPPPTAPPPPHTQTPWLAPRQATASACRPPCRLAAHPAR